MDKGDSVESALKISGNVNTSRCERRVNKKTIRTYLCRGCETVDLLLDR